MKARRAGSLAFLLVFTLMAGATAPSAAATSGRGFACSTIEDGTVPFSGTITNQTCSALDIGTLPAGTLLEISLITDIELDLIVFSHAGLGVYQNEQSYRSDGVWQVAATVESVNGSLTFRWTTPADRGDTRWHVVLDHMRHVTDGGMGGGGGADASVTLSVIQPTERPWTLIDEMILLAPGAKDVLSDGLTLAEGTEILIEAFGIVGDADVFMMTQSQKDTYISGQSADFRLSATDLLATSASASATWTVPAAHAGQPLFLIVDNAAGPAGGGSGSASVRIGVALSILPVLQPTISSNDDLDAIDVGASVTLDSSSTPNAWSQIDDAQTSWSIDGSTCDSENGDAITLCWDSPGTRNVTLSMVTIDQRSGNATRMVTVVDSTPPIASIQVSGVVRRGFGEDFTLTAQSSDNWRIESEEWWVDGELVSKQNRSGSTFTHSFEDLTDAGEHTVLLRAIDGAGLTTDANATIMISDTTPALLGDIVAEAYVMAGQSISFSLDANDPESPTLVWSWDFDREVDSDGDGVADGDVQATGDQVTTIFQEVGPHWVVCRVRNEVNLVAEAEFLVTVTADPSAEASSSELPIGQILGGIILLTIAVGAVAFWRNTQREARSIIEMETAAAEADATQEQMRAPTEEEQRAMFAPDASSSPDDQMAEAAGSDYRRSRIGSAEGEAAVDSAALAVLRGEDEPAAESAEKEVHDAAEQPAVNSRPADSQQAATSDTESSSRSTNKSRPTAGLVLPDDRMVGEAPTIDAASPEGGAEASLASPPDAGESIVSGTCTICGDGYEVTLPAGVDTARAACPSCGESQIIER